MKKEIGEKIKMLRVAQDITLQDLSAKTGLSIGFLSQLERGQSSPAIASLDKISQALSVEISYFFSLPRQNSKRITRNHEQAVFYIDSSKIIYYDRTNDLECDQLTPFIQTILPQSDDLNITPYSHQGEEFIYVLEGVLTLFLEEQRFELYPGDSCHIKSNTPHDWANFTGKNTTILSINTPQIFNLKDKMKERKA